MQMELTTLEQVQLEFEEYKKKVEASSRYIYSSIQTNEFCDRRNVCSVGNHVVCCGNPKRQSTLGCTYYKQKVVPMHNSIVHL